MAPGGSASHTASFDDSLPMSLIDPGMNCSPSLESWLVCSTLNQGAGNVRTAIRKKTEQGSAGRAPAAQCTPEDPAKDSF